MLMNYCEKVFHIAGYVSIMALEEKTLKSCGNHP
ncbi:hypothetical protein BSNT_06837 [Bacillus subtilis subsp. natto BEST195]|nr:hypothetical protein BSNT_06837 [Bacillus subtilis subsp. natto BEST195]